MLAELRVRHLGVIDDLAVTLGPGMTALTGETGAGKTLIVEAIGLLLGVRADPVLVRPGADEAVVEGRFVAADGTEHVLGRTVPARGRSRAYVDGRMATLGQLAAAGAELADLHGQHAHQTLLSGAAQRRALDRFAAVDLAPVEAARRHLHAIAEDQERLGGDGRARAREIDLLGFQLEELDEAQLVDADEDAALAEEESRLADATEHRLAAATAHDALAADGGTADTLGAGVAALAGRPPLRALEVRLRALAAEVADAAAEARELAESLEDDPRRLEELRIRRQLLVDLRRKYGATLGDVMAYRDQARGRLEELRSWDERAGRLEGERAVAEAALTKARSRVGTARREAAPALASRVQAHLTSLAMSRARFAVDVGADPAGDDVTWLLEANAGETLLPLAKVASGGELARTMLALRLTLLDAGIGDDDPAGRPKPEAGRTLVFDEVDAGIGGEAAVAVGRALAALAGDHQVLVVTHLPQVAAFADEHLAVAKDERDGRTVARAAPLAGAARVVELSRMLSGQPQSDTARRHAEELLAMAGVAAKGRPSSGWPGDPR